MARFTSILAAVQGFNALARSVHVNSLSNRDEHRIIILHNQNGKCYRFKIEIIHILGTH